MEGATAQRVVVRLRSRELVIGAACTAAIAVVAWPTRTLAPGLSGDWSWLATLSYAARHGLAFGSEIVFTYGPLGFLETWYGPVLYYPQTLLASWLFAAVLQLLLAATLLIALRRSLPPAAAAVVAALALALVPERESALGFAWCALLLARPEDGTRGRPEAAFPYAIGALTALALLGKLSEGIELLALALVTLAAACRPRDLLAFAGALLAVAASGWLATGQAAGDAWSYLRNGFELVAGYAGAMGLADPRGWTYAAAAALTMLALALAWDALRGAPARRRGGLVALCLAYAAFGFKEGFVLQDTIHMEVFFGGMVVLFAVLPVRLPRRPLPLGGLAACVVALGALVGLHELARSVNPVANASAAAGQLRTLASPARRAAIVADLQARVAALYALDPAIAAAVGRRSMLPWPFLHGEIAWAYGFELRPLPTLEPYAAYTPALDRLGAELLASPRAPQRVLRAGIAFAPGINGRHPTFEAPLATLEIFCRYRQVAARPPWHVLARGGDRCGSARTLASSTAAWGAPVDVPPPARRDALVLVRIEGAEPHGLEQLRTLALRPHARWIALDGARFRLVAATAPDGLLLHAPARADYPAPFAMAPNPRRIAVGRDGGEPGGELRYTFVEVPVRPFTAEAGGR